MSHEKKTVDELVASVPEDQMKAVWHKLGEKLHGGVHTNDSGNNGPPPPTGTGPHN